MVFRDMYSTVLVVSKVEVVQDGHFCIGMLTCESAQYGNTCMARESPEISASRQLPEGQETGYKGDFVNDENTASTGSHTDIRSV